MAKKKKFINNLTRLREGMELSQSEFARRLGVSASMIKKLEEGKRTISQELSVRIFAETGVMLVPGDDETPFEYSRVQHAAWQKEMLLDRKGVQPACRVIMRLIELMLSAATRPGVDKSYAVFSAFIVAIEGVKKEYGLEKHIEAELRDRQRTETKLYSVQELRRNDLLATQVGFKDDPALKDEEQIPLTKVVGWLPVKEIFNIAWQHREFIREIQESNPEQLTPEQNAKLEAIDKQQNAEIEKFLPL